MLAPKLRNLASAIGSRPEISAGQMRHSRVSTSLDIYAQTVPVSQRRAVEKLSEFANVKAVPVLFQ
jgi:hypothetical protein